MSKDKKPLVAADYRSYFFFKLFYEPSKTGGPVSMAQSIIPMLIYIIMGVVCSYMVVVTDQPEVRLDNLKNVFLKVMISWISINECLSYRETYRVYKYITSCMVPRYHLDGEMEILIETRKKARHDIRFYLIFLIANVPVLVTSKALKAFLKGMPWQQLPTPWPVPLSTGPMFFVSYVFQVVCTTISHLVAVVMLCTLTITKQIGGLFDVLILGINRIEERAERKMKNENMSYQDSMIACLKENIAHHRELYAEFLSERSHLEGTFLSYITWIGLIMACEAYPLVRKDLTVAIAIKAMVFLVIQTLTTAMFCNQLEILSDKNTEVFRTLYNCPWYKCNSEFRRLLVTGMMASREPMQIKGIMFHGLVATRATFYSTMVNTFNVLNMIRNAN